jgi:hypothetical protein
MGEGEVAIDNWQLTIDDDARISFLWYHETWGKH